ncbi:MAG: response regulator [Candidatus Omnitrophica bacterium]|nr:response regulator [Candidatus Omnitrophota bacterium]
MRDQKIAFFIDDDLAFLELIPYTVRHPRFEVRTYQALNGYQAIDEVIRRKPDVVFLDFRLPRANGGQILPILRSVKSLAHVPVYLVTGLSKAEVLPLLTDVNFDGVLVKNESIWAEVLKVLDRLDQSEAVAV